MTRVRTPRSEAGETLLEIVMAVMILGLGTTAVLGAMGMSITSARDHREQSVSGRVLDNFAEYLKDESTSPYVPCAKTSPASDATLARYDTYRAAFVALASTNSATNRVYEPTIGQYALTIRVDAGTPNPVLGADPATSFPALSAPASCEPGAAPYDVAADDDRVQRLTLSVVRPGGQLGATVQITKWRRS